MESSFHILTLVYVCKKQDDFQEMSSTQLSDTKKEFNASTNWIYSSCCLQ